jgi:hypothetical protein
VSTTYGGVHPLADVPDAVLKAARAGMRGAPRGVIVTGDDIADYVLAAAMPELRRWFARVHETCRYPDMLCEDRLRR